MVRVAATAARVTGLPHPTGDETILPYAATGSMTLTSQRISFCYFQAAITKQITSLVISSSSTAAGATPTLVRFGLWTVAANGDLTLVASTANDTTLLASTFTAYTKALSVAY